MARKTQISREVILDTALKMLIRDGYASINISTLAREIGCSTQPIAWHFGNMEGLRFALLQHCLALLRNHFTINEGDVASTLSEIQHRYIDLAFDYPNLYKYLYMSEHDQTEELIQAIRFPNYEKVLLQLQEEYGVSQHAAQRYLLDLQLYVHGIAACAASKLHLSFKENALQMVCDANAAFLEKMLKTDRTNQ